MNYFKNSNYYKVYKENLNFNDMLTLLQQSPNDSMYVGYLDGIYVTVSEANNKDSKFTINQVVRDDWMILVKDEEMSIKREDVQDYFEDDLNIYFDSRYYDPNKMSIDSMWQYVNDHYPSLIDDELLYEFIMYLRQNKKLNPMK